MVSIINWLTFVLEAHLITNWSIHFLLWHEPDIVNEWISVTLDKREMTVSAQSDLDIFLLNLYR